MVVEAMIGPTINVSCMRDMCGSEPCIEGRPSRRNPCVQFTVVCKHWRFDLGYIGSTGLISVELNCGIQVRGHPHGQYVDTPPPKQKPTAPSLPVDSGRDFNHVAAARKSSVILARSTSVKSFAPLSSSPGYPPTDVSPSGANARKFAIANLRATSFMYGLRPRFSWTTKTAGSFPVALAGRTM